MTFSMNIQMNEEQGLRELQKCTQEIRRGLEALKRIMVPLERIRTEKLYLYAKDDNGRPLYKSFEDYTKAEFGFARSNFSRLKRGYNAILELEQHVEPGLSNKINSPRTAYEISRLPEGSRKDAVKELAAEAGEGNITARMVSEWKNKRHYNTFNKQIPQRLMVSSELIDVYKESQVGDAHAEVLPTGFDISSNAVMVNADKDAEMPKECSAENASDGADGSTLADTALSDMTMNESDGNVCAEDADNMKEESDDVEGYGDDDEEDGDDEESDEDDTSEILYELKIVLNKLVNKFDNKELDKEWLKGRIESIMEDFWINLSEFINNEE